MKSVSKRKRSTTWQDEVKRVAAGIRKRVLEHTIKNNGGYLSQACSSAEILATLYVKIMDLGTIKTPLVPQPFPGVPGPDNPDYFTGASFNGPGPDHDRFFLSPAQYALVLYATLIETGRMAEEGLLQFNKDGSSVEMIGAEHSPGMETMTGSLGQGISQAAGIAMARKRKKEKGRVFIFMSDGEFQIGQTWEALQSLSFHRLDNVIIFVDVNGFQCDGKMCDGHGRRTAGQADRSPSGRGCSGSTGTTSSVLRMPDRIPLMAGLLSCSAIPMPRGALMSSSRGPRRCTMSASRAKRKRTAMCPPMRRLCGREYSPGTKESEAAPRRNHPSVLRSSRGSMQRTSYDGQRTNRKCWCSQPISRVPRRSICSGPPIPAVFCPWALRNRTC